MINYEWAVETLEGEENDVAEVDHVNSYAEAVRDAERLRAAGERVEIVLVRDKWEDDGNLDDRQWAYIGWVVDGRLPECFDGGARVPQRFHREVGAA